MNSCNLSCAPSIANCRSCRLRERRGLLPGDSTHSCIHHMTIVGCHVIKAECHVTAVGCHVTIVLCHVIIDGCHLIAQYSIWCI